MKLKARVLFTVLMMGFWVLGMAQSNSEKALFDKGLQFYKAGEYKAASEIFLSGIQQFPEGQLTTSFRYMLARTYYKMNDFTRTAIVAQNFFGKHPQSSYIDDMHHLLGNAYYKQGEYEAAIDEWQWVMEHSKDPRLKQMTGEYIFKTLDRFLSISQIEKLRKSYQNDFFDGVAKITIARKLLADGNTDRANMLLSSLLKASPNHPFAENARELLGAVNAGKDKPLAFLFLQDTAPDYKEISQSIALGMQYALNEYKLRNPASNIQLKIFGISPSVFNAVSTFKEALVSTVPLAVVSPVNFDQTAAVAALSGYESVPFVATLSSQTGLADLNKYVFQINPDARTKGQFLGSYASKSMGLKRLAILAPANEYGEHFVQSFVETAQSEGASVESIQWYYENSEDFNAQLRAIWRKGVYLAFQDSLFEAQPEADTRTIQKEYQLFLERKFKPRRPGFPVDSLKVPATGIDGLLVVASSPSLIPYLAPQVAYNNIRTTLLGNEGWNDPQQLRKYKDLLEGLTFISAGYFDTESTNYRLFTNQFRSKMQTTPERFHLLGYDIMKWLLLNYSPGLDRDSYRDHLERTNGYQGIMQSIQFGHKPRVNNKLSVLKLNYGQIIPLN
jgi:ABC-type branched-subunit amino acid transport system substrate-binding protein